MLGWTISASNHFCLCQFSICFLYSQKTLEILANFYVLDILFLSSLDVILLIETILIEKFGSTTLQKFLLSAMWLLFSEPWYCFFYLFSSINETQ